MWTYAKRLILQRTNHVWSTKRIGAKFILEYAPFALIWILFVSEVSAKGLIRFEDVSFPTKSYILNHTVTCDKFFPGSFVARTYTCAGLRVNGHRLAYGHYQGWSLGVSDRRCLDTNGVHEFGQLCKLLLKSVNAEHLGFKAVYIPNSTCGYIDDTRKLLRKVSESKYRWVDFPPGWGYTDTIQCMTGAT